MPYVTRTHMARQEGIEPPTHSLEGCCSIQLSYWRFVRDRPAPTATLQPKPAKVGAPGFEPGTSCSQSRRDTRLRYAPHENQTIVESRTQTTVNCTARTRDRLTRISHVRSPRSARSSNARESARAR